MDAGLTADDYFRVGFLTRCYEQQLTPQQTLGLIAKTAGVDVVVRAGWETCLEKQAIKLPWIPGITPQTAPQPPAAAPAAAPAASAGGLKMPWIPGITPQPNPQAAPAKSGFGGWMGNLQHLWKSMPDHARWPMALGLLASVAGVGGAMGGSRWGMPLALLGGGAMAYGGYNAWPQLKQHFGGGGQPAAPAAPAAPASTGPVGNSTALGGLPPGFRQDQVAGLVRPIVDHVMSLPEDQQMAYLSQNVPPQYLQQAHQMLQSWQQGSQFERDYPNMAPIARPLMHWANRLGIPGIPNVGTGEPADQQLQAWGVQPHEADYFLKTLGRMRQVQPQGGGIPQVAPTAAG